VIEILQTFTTVLSNTSGVLQLLFGVPAVIADTVELFLGIAMLVTIAFTIPGGADIMALGDAARGAVQRKLPQVDR